MSVLQLMKGRRNRLLVTSRAALSDWLNEDAPVFGYLLKVLLASLLAMWLSLRFELDQPRTAMLTVAIVMQSRSGMVFAKSYYRLLGTLVGIVVSLILVALFAQERVLFLLSMALWIGLCTAGSMVYRNHQSYGFVLAGYTLCIVGLPAAISPELTFKIAVTRISEILIGLICATMVSDLVFPQRIWDAIQTKVRQRFSDFSDLLRTTAQNSVSTKSSKQVLLRFIGDIYSLESFRASAIMENDGAKHNR
ncbi:MAG: FUSC family protein, partial [Pseudomonadota bacterium]